MSIVNYSLKHKGVRLTDAKNAWVSGKNGKCRLNPKYSYVGKIDINMPNMIVSATDNRKPKFKGSTYDLNRSAKGQIIDHFYDDKGKRNKKTVAYFGIKKQSNKKEL